MIHVPHRQTAIQFAALFLGFLLSTSLWAQKLDVIVGVKTMHGITEDFLLEPKNDVRSGFGLVYYFPIIDEVVYDNGGFGITWLAHWANQNGVGINYFRRWDSPRRWNKIRQWTFEYQYLQTGNYIYDPGYFAGTTEGSYAEFSEKQHNLAVIYGVHTPLNKSKSLEFFVELGAKIMYIERQYTIEGGYNGRLPSDRKKTYFSGLPIARIGFSVRVF